MNNLKSGDTKSQIKAHLPYLANYYFYNYKLSPRILRQHRVLQNPRKNKNIVITKPDKGNGVIILDQKLCNNAIHEIGTFNYNLARFLCDLLSHLVLNDYSCKDTFSFVSQIKNANLSKKFPVSYDEASLFTNIPLQETIDIAINLIFKHNPSLNITETELKKLFLFPTSQTRFILNSKFYNQIDGVAMGSPLVPVLWVFTNVSG